MTININIIHRSPQDEAILMKLSELAGAVATIETKVDSANAKLDAFIPGAADPNVPAEAEAGLVRVNEKVTALEAKIPTAA